jgi:hypothetical protein
VTESLRRFIEAASVGVEQVFSRTGRLMPMFHFCSPHVGDVAMPAPPVSKDLAMTIVREVLASVEATRVLFIDEAWTVRRYGTRDDLDKMRTMAPPSEQPDRIEVVIFSGEDIAEGDLMAQRLIIREDGKPPRLGPLEFRERPVYSAGRMVGLLTPAKGSKVN